MSNDTIEIAKIVGGGILGLVFAVFITLGLIWAFEAVFGLSDEQKIEMRVPQLLSEADGAGFTSL
jgi:hypothetical protein